MKMCINVNMQMKMCDKLQNKMLLHILFYVILNYDRFYYIIILIINVFTDKYHYLYYYIIYSKFVKNISLF